MRSNAYRTSASKTATDWFAQFLYERLDGRLTKQGFYSMGKVAKELGISRDTLAAYKYKRAFPDLIALAEILNYFGEEEIRIPLKRSVTKDEM